jgi:hypothetical protein
MSCWLGSKPSMGFVQEVQIIEYLMLEATNFLGYRIIVSADHVLLKDGVRFCEQDAWSSSIEKTLDLHNHVTKMRLV